MATTATARLPASFTSVYRLFLRTCSASVLQHQGAKRNLRHLWRPTFVAAAKIIRELQVGPQDSTSRNAKEEWLKIWEGQSESHHKTVSKRTNEEVKLIIPLPCFIRPASLVVFLTTLHETSAIWLRRSACGYYQVTVRYGRLIYRPHLHNISQAN